MNNELVSLYDDSAAYTFYIEREIIPKILEILKNSNLSFADTMKVPSILERFLLSVQEGHLEQTRFVINRS